jgi:hypothetical protein
MAEISTQAVIDAVTLALRASYPLAIIQDEEAAQGITPGAFFVRLVTNDQQRLNGPRFRRTPTLDVIYFSADSLEECAAVADTLSLALDMVITPGGDVLHGSGASWSIEDDVLHYTVTYGYNVLIETERINMETLKFLEGGL